MRFLDINSFYAERGGGIRTYHHAKLDWFARRPEHEYHFVRAGETLSTARPAENVTVTTVPGVPIGHGYRLILNYAPVARLIRDVRPDVVEAGDPFITVGFCRWLRRWSRFPGLLSTFWHSDPHDTWIAPWARRGRFTRPFRRAVSAGAAAALYRRQRFFDVAVATSRCVEQRLISWGYPRVAYAPLGVHATFLEAGRSFTRPPWRREDGPLPLLYAGRLELDKGVDVLLRALPGILADERFSLTVMGRGGFAQRFESLSHPRFKFLGYISERERVLEVFRQHRALLAPGPFETFGLAALEAMSLGLVVVGPAAGGVGEMLQELASPFSFPAGDPEAFARVVSQLAETDLSDQAARAQRLAEEYGDWNKSIGRLVGHYQSLSDASETRPMRAAA